MDCPHCSSSSTLERKALTKQGYKCYHCRNCSKFFNKKTLSPFNLLRYSSELIFKVETWRLRYKLSLRDLSELLMKEGITISHETVRLWEEKFAPVIEADLKEQRKGKASNSWYVDETLVPVKKELHYYYHAIDNRGRLVATTFSKVRDLQTAESFFKKVVETIGHKPGKVTTDKEVCYPKAINKVLGRTVEHRTIRYLNNRLEQDHRGIKQRIKPMLGFKSPTSAARFPGGFDEMRNYYRVREFRNEIIPAIKRRAHIKGQFFRLRKQFVATKLIWKQSEMVLV
jgi:transposase-like protein